MIAAPDGQQYPKRSRRDVPRETPVGLVLRAAVRSMAIDQLTTPMQ